MRVTLVRPPNGLYEKVDLAPPLSLLTIGAVLEQEGIEVSVLDMNLRGMRDHRWVQENFYENAVAAIAETNPDVVGFTSMAVDSHVCLELARRVKEQDPGCLSLFGGVHFSSIAREMLTLYPEVDYVITGEGEIAVRNLFRYLRGKAGASELENVAYRDRSGIVHRRVLKPSQTFEPVPFPAYHLVNLSDYFSTNSRQLLDYEHGRGCIFRCSFCYSPVHWGQGEQVKQIDRIVDEVLRLRGMGPKHLFFVQDNLLNSKEVGKEICQALTASRLGLTWNCYATLPHLSTDALDAMSEAGCISVFIGIDAVSSTAKKAFKKTFFQGWNKLSERLRACLERGIVPTCAFMVDIPEYDSTNTDLSLATALFAANLGCGIRMNTLTLYNQTETYIDMQSRPRVYTNLKPSLLLDTPNVLHDNPYAREHPELFPFHQTFLPLPVYQKFVTGMHMAYTLFKTFNRTMVQYVSVDNGSLWGLLSHLGDKIGDLTQVPVLERRPLECDVFLREFPRFTLSRQTKSALEMETAELELGRNAPESEVGLVVEGERQTWRAGNYEVIRLPYEPAMLDRLEGLPDSETPAQPYLLLEQNRRINYFSLPDDMARTLTDLRDARHSGQSIEVPPAVLSELVDVGILHTESA
jgi:anaerobic magnesium-protoporphyrin IX monomethyl ester cyclase